MIFMRLQNTQKQKEFFFCLEPLSPRETEFITSLEQGGEIVELVSHTNEATFRH